MCVNNSFYICMCFIAKSESKKHLVSNCYKNCLDVMPKKFKKYVNGPVFCRKWVTDRCDVSERYLAL